MKQITALVGGNLQTIHTLLLNLMKRHPNVAEVICRTALDYNMQPILRIKEPPLSEGAMVEGIDPAVDDHGYSGKGVIQPNPTTND